MSHTSTTAIFTIANDTNFAAIRQLMAHFINHYTVKHPLFPLGNKNQAIHVPIVQDANGNKPASAADSITSEFCKSLQNGVHLILLWDMLSGDVNKIVLAGKYFIAPTVQQLILPREQQLVNLQVFANKRISCGLTTITFGASHTSAAEFAQELVCGNGS